MKDRFFIEKKNDPRDFPFYNGQPRSIAMSQWLIMLGIVFLGFLIASFWIPNVPGAFTILIVVLFSCMNLIFGLGSLSIFAGKDAFTLFKKFNVKDLPFLLGTLILNIVYSLVASGIVGLFSKTNANPAAITHAEGSRALTHLLLNTLSDIPALLGEEFLATLPFLALLYFFYQRMNWSRSKSIGVALMLSSLIFGLLHLPTYQWNWLQVIFVIGLARTFETIAYIRTKSIWASFLVHFTFDTLTFLVGFLAS